MARLTGKVALITGTGVGMGRVGEADDVAKLAGFLASDDEVRRHAGALASATICDLRPLTEV